MKSLKTACRGLMVAGGLVSAIQGATAHVKLQSRDSRFKSWWGKLQCGALQDPAIRFLHEARRKEAHLLPINSTQSYEILIPSAFNPNLGGYLRINASPAD